MRSVYPSGADLAATSTPMVPSAPGLLSITTGWPRRVPSLSATTRARLSTPPPAAYGTTMWTGLSGYSALADNDSANPTVARSIFMRASLAPRLDDELAGGAPLDEVAHRLRATVERVA